MCSFVLKMTMDNLASCASWCNRMRNEKCAYDKESKTFSYDRGKNGSLVYRAKRFQMIAPILHNDKSYFIVYFIFSIISN